MSGTVQTPEVSGYHTVVDTVIEVLTEFQQPMHIRELWGRVSERRDGGSMSGMETAISKELQREDRRLMRWAPRTYALVNWYAQRVVQDAQADVQAEEDDEKPSSAEERPYKDAYGNTLMGIPGDKPCLRCDEVFHTPDIKAFRLCRRCRAKDDYGEEPLAGIVPV